MAQHRFSNVYIYQCLTIVLHYETWPIYGQAYISLVWYFDEKKGLCRVMAWMPFQKIFSLFSNRTIIIQRQNVQKKFFNFICTSIELNVVSFLIKISAVYISWNNIKSYIVYWQWEQYMQDTRAQEPKSSRTTLQNLHTSS